MNILSNKKNNILNYFLFFVTIIFIILRIIFSSGEVSPDSVEYFLQAKNFWSYKTNFALGYPFLIKIFSFLTGGEFVASKLINILSYLAIITFSYIKKIFFPQTLLVFSFYPFLNLYSASLSEPLYFFINYIIIYYTYKIISEGCSMRNSFILGVLFFLLISVRFIGIFVFISLVIFLAYFTAMKKCSVKSFMLTFLFIALGVSSYLIINYFYCGFMLGKRDHLHVEHNSFFTFISEMLISSFRDFSFLNVIIHKGILSRISYLNIWVSLFVLAVVIAIIIRKNLNYFDWYLLFSFLIIFAGVLYSYFISKIDNSVRIKSSAYLYLILFLTFNIQKKYFNYCKAFIVFILCLNILTLLKYNSNILDSPKKFSSLLYKSNSKNVNIVYKDYNDERTNPKILLFKAFLIDRDYTISETVNHPKYKKVSDSSILANDIISKF